MNSNPKMEQLDHVMPLWRSKRKQEYEPVTVKFEYEEEVKSKKTTTRTVGTQPSTEIKETVIETRNKKVYLKVYSQSEQEDCEHFFEAFERFKKELAIPWTTASDAMVRDATILFNGMEKMLAGTALTEWHDVIGTTTDYSWKNFKTHVATFITTKVCPDDAYSRQRTYLQERRMPDGMEVHDYWIRLQTQNRYLPYLISTLEELKRWSPDSDFKGWWRDGGLSEQELRNIVVHRVPQAWQRELERNDIGHKVRNEGKIEDLIAHYTVLQRLERRNRIPVRRQSYGRMSGPRRNNYGSQTRVNAYQESANSQRGRAWPGSQYNSNYQLNRILGRFVPYFQNQSGRSRGPNNNNSYAGRGRTNRRETRQQWQQRSQPNPSNWQHPQQNTSEAYYQEQSGEEDRAGQQDADSTPAVEDVHYTEDELITDWDESLFIGEEEIYAINEEPPNKEDIHHYEEDWRGFWNESKDYQSYGNGDY
jgi:hypothetical protein